MNTIKKTAHYFARKKYCRAAIDNRADLRVFQEKPTLSIAMGMVMIAFSYVIGLPAVVFLATLAIWLDKPLIGIIGGPLIYGISTLIFIIGIRLAGLKHIKALFLWMVRIILEKILGEEAKSIRSSPAEGSGITHT
ncbi:MAG: hypothetical protein A2031_01375 [Deltaproteobacteria bacterium RBG_19FT_COMBO_43_11]|nr:MAG: hypothetical protein A2W27_10185 [Deltaproteobacteria bacterium RBG_16_44_11]OGP89530.1 MAG: hypothetical protein A2031_01375 [Deltaproteobacteria bacterium RBG_19FT_COMBO_43_11]